MKIMYTKRTRKIPKSLEMSLEDFYKFITNDMGEYVRDAYELTYDMSTNHFTLVTKDPSCDDPWENSETFEAEPKLVKNTIKVDLVKKED